MPARSAERHRTKPCAAADMLAQLALIDIRLPANDRWRRGV
jgi:hypothetical protein